MTYGFDVEKSRISRSSTYKKVKQSYPTYENHVNTRNITEKRDTKLNTLRNITQKKQYGGKGSASRFVVDRVVGLLTAQNRRIADRRARVKAIAERSALNTQGYSKVNYFLNKNPSRSDILLQNMKDSARERLEQQDAFLKQRVVLSSNLTPSVESKFRDPVNFDNSTESQLALVRMAMLTEESRQIGVFNRSFVQGLLSLNGNQSNEAPDMGFVPGSEPSGVPGNEVKIQDLTLAIQTLLETIGIASVNAAKYETEFNSAYNSLLTYNTTVIEPLVNSINSVSQTIVNEVYKIHISADSLVESVITVNIGISNSLNDLNIFSSRLSEIAGIISITPSSVDTTKALNNYNKALTEYVNSLSPPISINPTNLNSIRISVSGKILNTLNDLMTQIESIKTAKQIAQTQLNTASGIIINIPGEKETATQLFFEEIPGGLSQAIIDTYRGIITTYNNLVRSNNTNKGEIIILRNGLRLPNDHSNLESLKNAVDTANNLLYDPDSGLLVLMESSRPPESLLATDPIPELILSVNLDPQILINLEKAKLNTPYKTLQDLATAVGSINSFLQSAKATLDSLSGSSSENTVTPLPTLDAINQIKINIATTKYNYNLKLSILLNDVSTGLATLYNISRTQNASKRGEKTTAKNTASALAVQAKIQFVINVPASTKELSSKNSQLKSLESQVTSKNILLQSYNSIKALFSQNVSLVTSDRSNTLKNSLMPDLRLLINGLNTSIVNLDGTVSNGPPNITLVKPEAPVLFANIVPTLEASKNTLTMSIELLTKYKTDITLQYQSKLSRSLVLIALNGKKQDKSTDKSTNLGTKKERMEDKKYWTTESSKFKDIYTTIHGSIKATQGAVSTRATSITTKKTVLEKIVTDLREISYVNKYFKFDTGITLSRLITLASIKRIVNTEINITNIDISILVRINYLTPLMPQTVDVGTFYMQMKAAEEAYNTAMGSITTFEENIGNLQNEIVLNIRREVNTIFNFFIRRRDGNLVQLKNHYSSEKGAKSSLQKTEVARKKTAFQNAESVKGTASFNLGSILNTRRDLARRALVIEGKATSLNDIISRLDDLSENMKKYNSILGLNLFKKRDALKKNIDSLRGTIATNLGTIDTLTNISEPPPFNQQPPAVPDVSVLNTQRTNLTNLNADLSSVKNSLSFYNRIIMMIEALKRRYVERIALMRNQTDRDRAADEYATEKTDASMRKVDGFNNAQSLKDALSSSKKDSIIESAKAQKSKADEIASILADINTLNKLLNDSKKYSVYDKVGKLKDIQAKILTLIQYRNELDSQIIKLNELISRVKNLLKDPRLTEKERKRLLDELNKLKDNLSRMEKERINIKDFITKLEIRLRQLREDIRNLQRVSKPEVRFGKPDIRSNILSNLSKFIPVAGVLALVGLAPKFNPTITAGKQPPKTTTLKSEDGCANGTEQGGRDGASAGFNAGLAEATRQYNLWKQQYLAQIPTDDSSNDNSNSVPTTSTKKDSKSKSNDNSNNNSDSV